MPKTLENYANFFMMLLLFHTFFEKGDNARNYYNYNRKQGFEHAITTTNSLKTLCQIEAKKNIRKYRN